MSVNPVVKRGRCTVNHDSRYPSFPGCSHDAVFLISHESWGVTLECCQGVADWYRGKSGWTVIAWDTVDINVRVGRAIPQIAAEYIEKWGLEVSV